MKIANLISLLNRFDLNEELEVASPLTILRNKQTGRLLLLERKKADDLLDLMPAVYERPW